MLPYSSISFAETNCYGLTQVFFFFFFFISFFQMYPFLFPQQSKIEDRLEEAIHVLRSHAVGQGPGLEGAHSDMHSLLSSVHNGGLGGLSPAFPNASLALSNRHPAMVSQRFPPLSDCFFSSFIIIINA